MSACFDEMLKLERSRSNAADLWVTLPKDDDDAFKKKTRQLFVTGSSYRIVLHPSSPFPHLEQVKRRASALVDIHCLSYAKRIYTKLDKAYSLLLRNKFDWRKKKQLNRHQLVDGLAVARHCCPYLFESILTWGVVSWGIMLYNVAYCSNYSPVNYHHQQQVCRSKSFLSCLYCCYTRIVSTDIHHHQGNH